MTSNVPRRPVTAKSPEKEHNDRCSELLALYERDDDFQAALGAFTSSHPNAITALTQATPLFIHPGHDGQPDRYLAVATAADSRFESDLNALLKNCGLDRLPDRLGAKVVLGSLASLRLRGKPFQLRPFIFFTSPAINATGDVDCHISLSLPDSAWDPTATRRADIREELVSEALRAVDRELDRIDNATVADGFRFPGRTPDRPRHLRWLFLRLAHCESCEDISKHDEHDHPVTEKRVQNATDELAGLLGLTSGTSGSSRFPRSKPRP